ncbi:MAG: sulfatase-like hydrolase/transferase [Solirubrobacterales bacterium]|nr:sulfatase-like hydrolase/transferase [Solirubrobacterales bacterium]
MTTDTSLRLRRHTNTIIATAAAFAALAGIAAVPAQAATAKPNIIVMTVDDQRQDDLEIMTKVKAQLQNTGVTFQNSLASYALCCPSRTTFLTGQYMHNHGITWNFWPLGGYFKFKHSTNDGGWGNILPKWLQNAGYHTGLIGKYLNQTGEEDPTTRITRTAAGTIGTSTITLSGASTGLAVGDNVSSSLSTTEATGTTGSTSVIASGSTSGIRIGDYAVGKGFSRGPTVTSIVGSTVNFSAPLTENTDSLTTTQPGVETGSKITQISGSTLTISQPLNKTLSGTDNIVTGRATPTEIPPGWSEWAGGVDPTTYAFYGYTLNVNGTLKTYGTCRHQYKTIDPAGNNVTPPLKTPYTTNKLEGCHEENAQNDVYLQNNSAKSDANYQTDVETTYAEKYIKANGAKSKPYFLWLTPTAPHTTTTTGANEGSPAIPPYRYRSTFATKALPNWPALDEVDTSDKPCIQSFFCWFGRIGADGRQLATNHYRGRQGSIKGLDDMVGRIVAAVKKTGEAKNTIIIYTSDNGWLLGEHNLVAQKQFGFEESIKVPLVISGPGFTGGKTAAPMVVNTDLAPTILRAAGATAGRAMDGVALQDILASPSSWLTRTVVIETGENPRAPSYAGIHNWHWHLEILQGGGLPERYELYDLSKDPFEMNAVTNDPAYAGVLAQLIAQDRRLATCKGTACRDTSAIPASPAHSSLDDVSMTTGLHTEG